ncbi:MAG: hypothetical protein HY929_01070 [Euryarchaeota archaeon]|nr:hypothetical protein [Euryarchaeota archaeon]
MVKIKVDIPESVNKTFKKRVAIKYGFHRGALSAAATEAFRSWAEMKKPVDPYFYVDSNLSIEIDPERTLEFLKALVSDVASKELEISFDMDKKDIAGLPRKPTSTVQFNRSLLVIYKLKKQDAAQLLEKINSLKPLKEIFSLMLEFDGLKLITGGEGCFSIHGAKEKSLVEKIVAILLKIHNLSLFESLPEHFALILEKPNYELEVIELGR